MVHHKYTSANSLSRRDICQIMDSANTDTELRVWLRWASEGSNAPRRVRRITEAALLACVPDYEFLRPVCEEFKRRYPERAEL